MFFGNHRERAREKKRVGGGNLTKTPARKTIVWTSASFLKEEESEKKDHEKEKSQVAGEREREKRKGEGGSCSFKDKRGM